jgi:hypothetical protein
MCSQAELGNEAPSILAIHNGSALHHFIEIHLVAPLELLEIAKDFLKIREAILGSAALLEALQVFLQVGGPTMDEIVE